jgi:hypothetical protein
MITLLKPYSSLHDVDIWSIDVDFDLDLGDILMNECTGKCEQDQALDSASISCGYH